MQTLIRGQKIKLADLAHTDQLRVGLSIRARANPVFDISCFGLDSQGQLSDDRYLIFYNQKQSPCGGLVMQGAQGEDLEQFDVTLGRLPPTIKRLVFTITIDGAGAMADVEAGHLRLLAGGREVARYSFTGRDFQQEKAIMVAEFYWKDVWRFAAVGQGFNGGLSALLKHFGGEEITESAALASPATPPPVSTRKPGLDQGTPKMVSLKKKVAVVLEKKNMAHIQARVALILDISGSMTRAYRSGKVQEVLDRIVAVASRLDDDGNLDVWMFSSEFYRLPVVTESNVENYINREILDRKDGGGGFLGALTGQGKKYHIFGGNDEVPAMRDVLKYYTKENPGSDPAFIVFISDGGVGNAREMEKMLVEASRHPLFWQFVGLEGSNYGPLERLDTMRGRVVDNANFFQVDDLNRISDEVLYDRLLNEFPQWIKEAQQKRIL